MTHNSHNPLQNIDIDLCSNECALLLKAAGLAGVHDSVTESVLGVFILSQTVLCFQDVCTFRNNIIIQCETAENSSAVFPRVLGCIFHSVKALKPERRFKYLPSPTQSKLSVTVSLTVQRNMEGWRGSPALTRLVSIRQPAVAENTREGGRRCNHGDK